jgi:hypothetical protein
MTISALVELLGQADAGAWFLLVKRDHADLFPSLPDVTRDYRVARNLERVWADLTLCLANLVEDDTVYVVDSQPIPVCKGARFNLDILDQRLGQIAFSDDAPNDPLRLPPRALNFQFFDHSRMIEINRFFVRPGDSSRFSFVRNGDEEVPGQHVQLRGSRNCGGLIPRWFSTSVVLSTGQSGYCS